VTLSGIETVSKKTLHDKIHSVLKIVPRDDSPSKKLGADFRQDAVRAEWETTLATLQEENFSIIRLNVVCGSGTYMRSLAERLGEALGTGGLALSIHRTHIGRYVPLPFGFGFWRKMYR